MTLQEWNRVQVYIYRKFKLDPQDLKLIMNIASCISCYREEKFSMELLEEVAIVVECLIEFLGDEKDL